MLVKPFKILLSISCLSLIVIACGLIGGKDKSPSYKNPVYANVYFENNRQNSAAPVQGLLAIDYNNPKEYKLLSSDTAAFRNVRLSPDGSMISYSDKYVTGVSSTPWLGIYDIKKKKRKLLIDTRYDAPLVGNAQLGVVWDKESTGFYYTNPDQAFSNTQSVWYYDLETERATIIKEVIEKAVYPVGFMGGDTLLIRSNEFDSLGHYYTMTLEGEYIHQINNPYLEETNVGGVTKRGLLSISWNDSLKLFAGSYINGEEFEGYRIAITDLNGEVFGEFANGDYLNDHPRWTRDGKIIFTEQRDILNDQVDSELKLLDPETGEITRFFSSREYPEITGVGNADQ